MEDLYLFLFSVMRFQSLILFILITVFFQFNFKLLSIYDKKKTVQIK